MGRRQVPSTVPGVGPFGAINARERVITDYEPNPHNPGAQIMRDGLLRLHGFLVPAVLGGDTDPSNQFHGYGPQLQDFKGGSHAANPVVYADPTGGEIGSAVVAGPMGDPARRIFADRLARRQGGSA